MGRDDAILKNVPRPRRGAGRKMINSIDLGIVFWVSFPFSGARQERRDLFG